MDRVNGLHLKRCYLPLLSDCESDVDTPASPESESSNLEVGASGDSHDSGSSQLEEDKESDLEVAASGDSHDSGSSQLEEDKESDLEVAASGDSHSGSSQLDENKESNPVVPGSELEESIPHLPLPMPPLQSLQVSINKLGS